MMTVYNDCQGSRHTISTGIPVVIRDIAENARVVCKGVLRD